MASSAVEAPSQASVALGLARERLLALQHEHGWWQGELQTNVTMDAEDMLLREFLGVRREDETRRSAAWIRSQQRADGTWANFHGGPGELSTTIEAYWALRLAGDDPQPEHRRAAPGSIRAGGGRIMGRDPATLGLLADGAAPARLSDRAPGHAPRPRRSRRLHGRGSRRLPGRGRAARPEPAFGSLPVARVGHRAGRYRPERR